MKESGREDQNPWAKWYWADWSADVGLRACGLAAKGLWVEMLAIMARSKRKGFLMDGNKKMEIATLSKLLSEPELMLAKLMQELALHNVFSCNRKGIIYHRRMVQDYKLTYIRSLARKKGGRPKKQNENNGISKTKGLSASASASASKSEDKKESVSETVRTIVDYLNEKTGKKFRPVNSTASLIKARLSENRTADDFRQVINIKCAKWKGKTWTDTRTGEPVNGDDYLRPSTLFSAKNFESYVNESMPGEQKLDAAEFMRHHEADLKR